MEKSLSFVQRVLNKIFQICDWNLEGNSKTFDFLQGSPFCFWKGCVNLFRNVPMKRNFSFSIFFVELTWKSLYIGFEETFSYPIGNDSFWKEIHIVGILKKIFGTIFLSLWKTWLKMWISWRNPLDLFKKMSKTHKNFQLFSKKNQNQKRYSRNFRNYFRSVFLSV